MKLLSVFGGRAERSFCFIHNTWEWWFPWNYRACGECGHVWKTRGSFANDVREMDASMREYEQWWQDTDPNTITACPLCAHDF